MQDPKEDWKNFLEWIDQHSANSYYRGHSDKDYLLMPKVGRSNYSLVQELNMFEHFKRRAGLYSNFNSDFEWLALAQHHGLPTRLLDWTLNPLVAAFFAVSTNKRKIGRIYSLNTFEYDFVDLSTLKSPFHINKIEFLHPPISTRRIELQKGIFSVHPLPDQPVFIIPDRSPGFENDTIREIKTYHNSFLNMEKPDFSNIESVNLFISRYYNDNEPFFDIPSGSKDFFEKKIRHLGIDETIFGDIDSIAKNIHFLHDSKSLKQIIEPNYKMVKPFWEKMAGELMSEYLVENQEFLIENIGLKIYNSEFSFHIEELQDNHYNLKTVIGHLAYVTYPNFENADKVTFIKNESNRYDILWDFLHDLNVKSSKLVKASHSSIKIKIDFYTEGFTEVFKLRKVEVIAGNKTDIQFFEDCEKQFTKLKSQILKDDFDRLLLCTKNDLVYNQIGAKYQNKISF